MPFNFFFSHHLPETCANPPEAPINGNRTSLSQARPDGRYAIGSQARYACNPGFISEGVNVSNCQDNGQWSERTLTCTKEAITCPPPVTPPNARVLNQTAQPNSNGRYQVGNSITYRCLDGFDGLNGQFASTFVCMNNASWVGCPLTCLAGASTTAAPVTCPPPVRTPDNTRLLPTSAQPNSQNRYNVGDTLFYICDGNFNGTPNQTCLANGTWSEYSVCTPGCNSVATCGVPPVPANARMLPESSQPGEFNRYSVGDTILYDCDTGYSPTGFSQITCSSAGSWSPLQFTCALVTTPTTTTTTTTVRTTTLSMFLFLFSFII